MSVSTLASPVSGPVVAPLKLVYGFTFINSLGTGVVTNGIFFLTKQGYGFTETQNYLLGVALGLTYIAGALGAGPALGWLAGRFPSITSRAVLFALMVLMAALCSIPQAALWVLEPSPHGGVAGWPVWLTVVAYSPLSGVLWPMVESYVSGGRSGESLRRAVGRWNIVWSSSLVVAYCGLAPVIENHAAIAVMGLGGLHLLAAALLIGFTPEPAEHAEGEHEPHPPVYRKLLVTFRLLLPMSYIVASALGPYLPAVMERLSVPRNWQTVLTTAWLLPRALTFLVLGRWQAWHGRWSMAVVGCLLLLSGFTLCVLAGWLFGGSVAVGILLGGLAMFGVGMATIYSGALYYAMEVGKAEVGAGGAHEALIGAGYTVGPLCGVLASGAVDLKLLEPSGFEPMVLTCVGVVALLLAGVVVRRVFVHAGS